MAHSTRFSVPPAPRRRNSSTRSRRAKRPPVVGVERLWTRLADLFRSERTAAKLATTAVLAPRRLEPRRMLDAGAAALALETLDYSADYVQAGNDYADLAPLPALANASAEEAPAATIEVLPT